MGQMVDFTMERGRSCKRGRQGRAKRGSGSYHGWNDVLLYHKARRGYVQ